MIALADLAGFRSEFLIKCARSTLKNLGIGELLERNLKTLESFCVLACFKHVSLFASEGAHIDLG